MKYYVFDLDGTVYIKDSTLVRASTYEAFERIKANGDKVIIAFGDNDNDIPMFELADQSFCMADGSENAKKQATKVIGVSNSDSIFSSIQTQLIQPTIDR